MRFLVDANLPPALARWLIEAGEIAVHVAAGGMFGRTDASIWDEALATAMVIVTRDDGFARGRSVTRTGPQIVWVGLGNARRAYLLRHMTSIWPDLIEALRRGEAIVEVR